MKFHDRRIASLKREVEKLKKRIQKVEDDCATAELKLFHEESARLAVLQVASFAMRKIEAELYEETWEKSRDYLSTPEGKKLLEHLIRARREFAMAAGLVEPEKFVSDLETFLVSH